MTNPPAPEDVLPEDNEPKCQVCGKRQGFIVGENLGDCSLACISSHIKCREAFENWYTGNNTKCPSIARKGNGYKLMQAEQAWQAWSASWYSAWNTRTPVIADTTDLFICRRSVAGDDRDGATRYYVYEPLRPYEAIADGVGVEEHLLNALSVARKYKTSMQHGVVEQDFASIENELRDAIRILRAPPQAATDEGADEN